MKFGVVETRDALGTILAHSTRAGSLRFKKGRRLSGTDIDRLLEENVTEVIVARLEPGDVDEDAAASALADVLARNGITRAQAATGRVNLFAGENGLFHVERAIVDRLNLIDPAITLATVPQRTVVASGDMVATIKIIPLAVSDVALRRALDIAATPMMAVHPFRPMRVGLIATTLDTLKPSVMDKTARVLQERLALSSSRLTGELRVAHDEDALAGALGEALPGNDVLILFGASAVVDQDDVIPAAIRKAGGHVEHVGMPVDPGNLLVLGSIGDVVVIGAPGCARSPKENGFDWVLNRVLTGETPTGADLMGMGVGGLLKEIPARPQPRVTVSPAGTGDIAIVLLAAGRASRMGDEHGHKLLARFDGLPLVRRMAMTALEADIGPVIVITGHRALDVSEALSGLAVCILDNPAHDLGMAGSLAMGLRAIGADQAGALVLLADMPGIEPVHLVKMARCFRDTGGHAIIRASAGGQRGNPVILPRAAFADVLRLKGDVGARSVIESGGYDVVDVDIGMAAHIDVDTPEAVMAAGGIFETDA